ncbi:MAG: adenylate/guanylate cyclase domain-containing protein [Limisphaerales bacterium]
MFNPSFRVKLLLAMLLLVGGVSTATLYSSRVILQRSYQEALQAQFRTQIEYFAVRQESRLGEIKLRCAALAQSDRLQTAMIGGDPQQILSTAREALAAVLTESFRNASRTNASRNDAGRMEAPPPGPNPDQPPPLETVRGAPGEMRGRGRQGGPGGGGFGFLRVLDANGEVLRGEEIPATRRPSDRRDQMFDDQLASLGRSLHTWDVQQVAYLAPMDESRSSTLLEVVVTRVIDLETDRTLGAVVMGSPLFDRAEEMRDLSEILSGIWLDGQLHTRTVPEDLRGPLTTRLQQETAGEAAIEKDFVVTRGGETFRAFLRLMNPDSPFPLAYQVKLFSLANSMQTQRKLQSVILTISLLVLLVGVGVSLVLANSLTRSVRELDAATAEVQRGNFQVRVPVRSRDDIGRLVRSFNEMTDGLAQKDRYRRVLNLVADARVATALLENDQLPVAGSRTVTVLFCDIRGFTALTQGMPADEIIRVLNEHMTLMTQVVYEHHGFVDKFVGDLIMAVFGAPLSDGNDTQNALACARKMISARAGLNRTAHPPFEVGISLATGEVVAGLMGSHDRANYTVLGSSVNLAARLCAQASPGQVLVDAATRARLADPAELVAIPPLRLKGFAEPVAAWELPASPPSAPSPA